MAGDTRGVSRGDIKRIQTAPARRRGKFRRLVEDFESTLAEHSAALPLETIEQFLADRITAVAAAVGLSEQTVLGTYFTDTWGADMARQALEDRAIGRATEALAATADLPVALAGRLIAALGQAQRFAATNTGIDTRPAGGTELNPHSDPAGDGLDTAWSPRVAAAWENAMPGGPPAYDPAAAADATSAFGLALHEAVAGDAPAPSPGMLTVPGEAILHTRRALEAFEQQLRRGRWVSCRCPDCSPTSTPGPGADPAPATDSVEYRVAEQVAADRALLDRYAPAQPAPPAESFPFAAPSRQRSPGRPDPPGSGPRTPPPA